MKRKFILTAALLVFLSTGIIARAQMPAPPPAPEVQLRSTAELDQMLGPIALYPDPLIAQILPAATLPSEVVLADRYVNGGGDPNLIDQQPWDPSVMTLARYPALLKWMDDNLAWTTALGQAFLYQQPDVMDSIQRLRAQAQALGNLQPTTQENVIIDNGIIEILPANPQVIYVPVYQPEMVFFQRPFASSFISFGMGLAVGAWLNHDFDWHNHHLIVWRHDQPRPADWWYRRPGERPPVEANHATVWQPRSRPDLTARSMDRGWDSRQVRSTVTVIGGQPKPAERHETPAPPLRRPEPTVRQPAVRQPTVRQPVVQQPTVRQPVVQQPTVRQPVVQQPTVRQPVVQQPTVRQPVVQQPTVRQPVVQQPTVRQPVVQQPAEASRSRPANGALIGVQSSQATRQFSNRGQESRQTTKTRPAAPPARPAAPAHAEVPSRPTGAGKR